MRSFSMIFSHQSVLKEWCHQKTQEVLHTKTCRSPPPVPTVTLKDNWRKDLKIDAAASLIVHLIGQKALYTVLVEIACVTQNSRVS